jgi:hypothetical protein
MCCQLAREELALCAEPVGFSVERAGQKFSMPSFAVSYNQLFLYIGASTLKNSDFVVEQYRAGKLVRVFVSSGDNAHSWQMHANGKTYLRTSGWVLSKILPTLMDASPITTRVIEADAARSVGEGGA